MHISPRGFARLALALRLAGVLIAIGGAAPARAESPAQREFDSVMRVKADAARGAQIFDTCSACHGSKGTGANDGTVPAIAGQHFRVIVWELIGFRRGQRTDPRMQHFTDQQHLEGGTQDIADVAEFVSRLTPSPSSSQGDGEHTAVGGDLYKRHCSSCHEEQAQGNDRKRTPRLAGQHYEYLLRTLRDAQRSNYPRAHHQLLSQLEPLDLTSICGYLSRLNP